MIRMSLPLLLASFAFVCSAQPLETREANAGISVYAFGDGINGFPLYYANGIAKIGDPTQSIPRDVNSVTFTISDSAAYTWVAHTDSNDTTSQLLYMADSVSSEVGFTASTNTTDKLTNVWWRYGQYVMTKVDGATFYAEPVTGVNGWYTLSWNNGTDESGMDKVLVTLRTIEPSTQSVLT